MKKILTWLAATAAGVVLLFSYRTSTQVVTPSAEPAPSRTETAATPATPATGGGTTGLKDGTYTGTAVDTRFGPVQVKITVQGGAVTAATAVEYPSESRRDQQINAYAIPVLEQESVGVQDAQGLDMITGATYTSEGYLGSLQAALDEARP